MSPERQRSDLTDDSRIQDESQLLEYFRSGEKPPKDWGIGIEYERIGISLPNLLPVPYSGRHSITSLLEGLRAKGGWNPIREEGRIIALERNDSRVTLEPGGQLELSGRVHENLEDLEKEVREFQEELRKASSPMEIRWMAIGLRPFADLEDIPWVPKARYRILSEHLARKGPLAHHMMKLTAGIQVNLDYGNEEDAMEKFRLGMGLTSIVTGLFANSPISQGNPNGYMTRRAWIWLQTDPDRCGLLRFAFDPDLSFQRYTDYALDVPSLWLMRNGRWFPTGGVPFRRLLRTGWQGKPLKMGDWALHLTSLFPEVRLKRFLEIRSSDSNSVPLSLAFSALWKGVLYDPEAREAAWELVEGLSWKDRLALHSEVCRRGMAARVGGFSVREAAERLLSIARQGLKRQGSRSQSPEERYLDPARALVRGEGTCPAQNLLRLWTNREWEKHPGNLVEYCARIDPEGD